MVYPRIEMSMRDHNVSKVERFLAGEPSVPWACDIGKKALAWSLQE